MVNLSQDLFDADMHSVFVNGELRGTIKQTGDVYLARTFDRGIKPCASLDAAMSQFESTQAKRNTNQLAML